MDYHSIVILITLNLVLSHCVWYAKINAICELTNVLERDHYS